MLNFYLAWSLDVNSGGVNLSDNKFCSETAYAVNVLLVLHDNLLSPK